MSEKRAFTLIELLIVMAVTAVLLGGLAILLNPGKRIGQANDTKIRSDIAQIGLALKAYYTKNSYYPINLSDLVSNGDLKTEPKSPSKTAYNYTRNSGCQSPPLYTGCEAVVDYPLQDPVTSGNVWCFRSATGQASEIALASCTP